MIFNEDCLETLNRNLEYDYVITSPPDLDEIGSDTKNITPYVEFLTQRLKSLNPKNNVVTIFVSDRKANGTVIQKHMIICDIMNKHGWKLKSQKLWVKKINVIDMYRFGYTFILTFDKKSRKHPLLPDVFYDKFIRASPKYTYNFSPSIVKEFIKSYTKENEIVFDPFMGSGTTAMVCIENNRDYIGSEIVKETYTFAKRNIDTTLKQNKFLKYK